MQRQSTRPARLALKASLAIILSLGLLCIMASAAFAATNSPARPAHAKVVSSDPAIGSTINKAPAAVTVTTAEDMNPDPSKSNLTVYGPSADATSIVISQGDAKVSLSNPKQMAINITPNSGHIDGVYVVVWKTVSADDGDAASGAFSFTVNTSAANSSATPTPAQNQTTTTSTSTSSGTPVWVAIVAALVALVIGLGIGLGFGRRKPAATSSLGAMRASVADDLQKHEKTLK